MIPGLNTDVRYKGKTFHIQTEDSGPDNPVLITHVFLGGTILGTEKQTYESDASDDLETHVRELMRTQHRQMYRALLDGEYDDASRRPPRSKKASGAIPLAKNRKGIINRPTRRPTPSSPMAPEPDEPDEPELVELVELAEPSTQPIPSVRSNPPSRPTAVNLVEPGDGQPAEPRLAFPTALTSARPVSDLVLAYLLEEPDEA